MWIPPLICSCESVLTHCRLNELTHTIYLKILISVLGIPAMWFSYSERKLVELYANSEEPDQMPHSAASDLGLHCLPATLLGVSPTAMG